MSVFGAYSRYYNLLYKDKDYRGEADYVTGLIKSHAPNAKELLDLGCGTGLHDALLAQRGFRITGVDMSEDMLETARNNNPGIDFIRSDIRSLSLERSFDAVVSLFHVVSYMTSNDDLQRMFTVVSDHLKPEGAFVFDVWYGPAVLTDRPAVRVKSLEDTTTKVIRNVTPVIHANENIVDVNYQMLVIDKKTSVVEEITETHHMRYLFKPELEVHLSACGMKMVKCEEWVSGGEPGFGTWGVSFVARRV
jgi:SAM-dependent methyltransferase